MTSDSGPLKAVLFDLDNTFILFDERQFFKAYMPRLATVFSDIIPVERFRDKIIESTQTLIANDGSVSNMEAFMRPFSEGIDATRDEIEGRFARFYETEFDKFQVLVERVEAGSEVVKTLKRNGLKVAIASNPVWPLQVQEMRLAWAGLEGFEFDWITHIGNTSSCKPHLRYYEEICDALSVSPESCMMVGNDPVNDMVAGLCGMKTFLATDGEASDHASLTMSREIHDQALPDTPEPDFSGWLSEVPKVVKTLV
jgi:FMN phosphatase YigB (HAD superfamily)